MSTQWWVVVAVVLIVIAVFVYLRSRRTQVSQAQDRRMSLQAQGRAESPAEEISQREDRRLAGMTAEDREWEQGSLQRNRERVERAQRAEETEWTHGGDDLHGDGERWCQASCAIVSVAWRDRRSATTDASESEYFQFYIETVPLDRADWLTQQINGTLKAISEANGTVVDHSIDIVGTSYLVARIVYTLPKGTTLPSEVSR
jgi:hypothetical protein